MPPTTPPKVKTRFTNTTGDKVTVMTDGTKTRVPAVTPNTSIPSVVAEGNTNPLNIPEPKLDTVNASTAVTTADALTGSIQEQEAARAAQEAEAAKAKVDTSEATIRDTQAILGTESQKRTELENKAGIPGANKRLQELSTGLASATANLRQFDLDFTNQLEQTRVDMGNRDITKRTFNSASAEANVQKAVQRAGMVANVYAQQASIQILSDNVKAATESVDKALTSFYDPIRQEMEMEKMFFQRNANSFDNSQNRAASARLEVIKQQQNEIDRAIASVDAAVASGGATPDDITSMTDPNLTPVERNNIARGVIARTATEQYNLEKAIKGRQLQKLGLEIDSENAKILAAENAAKNGTLTPEQLTQATELRKEVNGLAEVKAAKDLEANVAGLIAALQKGDGVSDIAAINMFQRIVVDPGVAVREGDVALLQTAQSYTDKAWLQAQGLLKGDKLTPEARQQMLDIAKPVYQFRVDFVDENTEQVRTTAQAQGIDYGKFVGKNFSSFEDLQAKVNPTNVQFGLPETESYLDDVLKAYSTSPESNPWGVPLQ